jgi:hypothetical protein
MAQLPSPMEQQTISWFGRSPTRSRDSRSATAGREQRGEQSLSPLLFLIVIATPRKKQAWTGRSTLQPAGRPALQFAGATDSSLADRKQRWGTIMKSGRLCPEPRSGGGNAAGANSSPGASL